ncbi:unnamed protein product [Cutaneotrichosporon oleaginosum]
MTHLSPDLHPREMCVGRAHTRLTTTHDLVEVAPFASDPSASTPSARDPGVAAGRQRRKTEPSTTPHPFSAAACAQRTEAMRAMDESRRHVNSNRTVSAPGFLRTRAPVRESGSVFMTANVTPPANPTHQAPTGAPAIWSPPPIGTTERAIICPFEPQWLIPPLPINPSFLATPSAPEVYSQSRRGERSKSATYATQKRDVVVTLGDARKAAALTGDGAALA